MRCAKISTIVERQRSPQTNIFNLSRFSADLEHNSSKYLHLLIESIQLAFADGLRYVADPSISKVPIKQLLSKEYAAKRRTHIHKDRFRFRVLAYALYSDVLENIRIERMEIDSNAFRKILVQKSCAFTKHKNS